jgi:hypothetical protein
MNIKRQKTHKIIQYHLKDEDILNFKRNVISDKDCFINAMQLLNYIDPESADKCRMIINSGKYVKICKVKNFFNNENSDLVQFTKEDINKYIVNIENEHGILIMLCEKYPNPSFYQLCHVFIVHRNKNGVLSYVDPQIQDENNIDKLNQMINKSNGIFVICNILYETEKGKIKEEKLINKLKNIKLNENERIDEKDIDDLISDFKKLSISCKLDVYDEVIK